MKDFLKFTVYRAIAGLLMYDITNRNSFNNINKWLDETKNYAKETIVLCLVGNKSDLEGIFMDVEWCYNFY